MNPNIPPCEMVNWVAQATSSCGLVDTSSMPYLVKTWRSRTATLHHFAWASAAPDVVAKVHVEPGHAEALFHGLNQVRNVVDELPSTEFTPVTPLAFSQDLGTVLMPYIHGKHLSDVVLGGAWVSDDFRAKILRHMYGCGLVLSRYHAKYSTASEDAETEARTHISARLERAFDSRLNGLGKLNVGDRHASKSYGDFHLGHLIATDDGRLALIDPPIETKYRYVHRDIALFKYKLFMALISPTRPWSMPLRTRHHRSLVTAFIEGYADGAQRALDESDRLAIEAYEAFYFDRMLRRTQQNRSYVRLAYYSTAVNKQLKILRRSIMSYLT